MHIDLNPVLYIVDEDTMFHFDSCQGFIPMKFRIQLQSTGPLFPGANRTKLLTDQRSHFFRFVHIDMLSDMEVSQKYLEYLSSLRLAEWYHKPILATFRDIKVPKLKPTGNRWVLVNKTNAKGEL